MSFGSCQTQFHYLLARRPWASEINSLSLNFLIGEMGITVISLHKALQHSQGYRDDDVLCDSLEPLSKLLDVSEPQFIHL